jgi:hypothetical protein
MERTGARKEYRNFPGWGQIAYNEGRIFLNKEQTVCVHLSSIVHVPNKHGILWNEQGDLL